MRSQVYPFQRVVKPRREWTESIKRDILERYNEGYGQTIAEIAVEYEVSHAAIRRWLTQWGAYTPTPYEPAKPYKAEPKEEKEEAKKEETPLQTAIRLLGARVRVDTYGDGICVYRLDDKRINPYFLIDIAGVQNGRAWV